MRRARPCSGWSGPWPTIPAPGGVGFGVSALATLGEVATARRWIARALEGGSRNLNMRYNFACALAQLGDADAAIELLGPWSEVASRAFVDHATNDPDLAPIRDRPGFKLLVAEARARHALDADTN